MPICPGVEFMTQDEEPISEYDDYKVDDFKDMLDVDEEDDDNAY